MIKIVLFGGTSEGRILAAKFAELEITTCVSVTTEYGASLIESSPFLEVVVGRLSSSEMIQFLAQQKATLVVDATHPYATLASEHIKEACSQGNLPYIRIIRQGGNTKNLHKFATKEEMITWLNTTDEVIFSTLGSKEVASLKAITNYKERVWVRVLPYDFALEACSQSGFSPGRIICMQGPFSEELNEAMFRHANASILITKDTGEPGGFAQKVNAATKCGMKIALLERPQAEEGFTITEFIQKIKDGEFDYVS